MTTVGQEQGDSLSGKLQALYDELPSDEQVLLKELLLQAGGEPEVSAYDDPPSNTAVVGSSGSVVFTVTPPVTTAATTEGNTLFPGVNQSSGTGTSPSIGIGIRF
jgi:hypothetical protein